MDKISVLSPSRLNRRKLITSCSPTWASGDADAATIPNAQVGEGGLPRGAAGRGGCPVSLWGAEPVPPLPARAGVPEERPARLPGHERAMPVEDVGNRHVDVGAEQQAGQRCRVSLCQRRVLQGSPGGSGGPGRLDRVQSIRRPPPEGLTRCRTGRTAAPTRCPPRPSPRAFGRMSAPALPPVRAWAGATPAGCRRRVAEHRQLTGRATRASHEVMGARGHQGGQRTGAAGSPGHPDKVGWPDGHLSPKAVITITGRHPVPVTHRSRPRGAHGPAPRPGRRAGHRVL
jgi:hypothetical protein